MDGPVLESMEVLESRVTKQGRVLPQRYKLLPLSSHTACYPSKLQGFSFYSSRSFFWSYHVRFLGPSASAAMTELKP